MVTITQQILIVNVSDRITDAFQDRIEKVSHGTIIAHSDDGAGHMKLYIKPKYRLNKKE